LQTHCAGTVYLPLSHSLIKPCITLPLPLARCTFQSLLSYVVSNNVFVCLCGVYACATSQRLLTELIINKPLEPLDFIIDFLKRDDDGKLHETKGRTYFNS